ncbi:MAG: glycosyltransferase family 1 protein [Microcoleaceae cyanobacterium]
MSNSLLINLSVLIPEPTGISIYAHQILPHLQYLDPTLLMADSLPKYHCYPIAGNMTPAQGTKGHFRRLLWTQWQLPLIYKALKGNLLFSPLPEAPLYTKCRSIVMAHDLIPLRFPRKGSRLTAYFKYYIPKVLTQAEHVICNSEATANDLVSFYQIPANKITPILLGYNHNQFKFLNLPKQNYFLYLGRHDAYKNLARLISAFAQLPNYSDYELWFAGPVDQTYTPQLKHQVQELGLSHNVKFLDYVEKEQLTIIINQAIALVFPSLWEGFGFPVLEAMACGTPVITSNCASIPEVGGDAVIYINPENINEMTAAMDLLAGNSLKCSQLRQAGLNRAKQFSWEKTGQKTAQTIQKYL